jgi:putative flippase GtrA
VVRFAAVLAIALAVLHLGAPGAGRRAELVTLIAANLAATLLRFLLFRAWVFPARRTTGPSAP